MGGQRKRYGTTLTPLPPLHPRPKRYAHFLVRAKFTVEWTLRVIQLVETQVSVILAQVLCHVTGKLQLLLPLF